MEAPNNQPILIVDDEPDIREVLAITLVDMGYRTLEAENATKAFAQFTEEQPRIVITDIKMPGSDGIELLRKIKHENPETEVIMITGHGDMNLAVRSLKYEATDFITKPINVDALEIALRRAAGLHPQPRTTGA
jgi:DNA-binding NtrC family response regulator